jgi:hypothetical protein
VDWYRAREACGLVEQYYVVLRSVLRSQPHLRRCLSRCQHCRIFLLAHPRNAGRKDLGCPFGCREELGKQSSKARSAAYYQTPEGKAKKKLQNAKRKRGKTGAAAGPPLREAVAFDPRMVRYVAMVASLIEGRRVGEQEMLQRLLRAMRQHSMARRRRMDYVVTQLEKHGP